MMYLVRGLLCLPAHCNSGLQDRRTWLFSKWTVISGEGITIFSNSVPCNYQILQEHLDNGNLCGLHLPSTFQCSWDNPVDTRRWNANYKSSLMMMSLCKQSPTLFPLLYTKCALWPKVLPVQLVNRNLLGLEHVHLNKNTWKALQTLIRLYPACRPCWLQDLPWDLAKGC